MHVHAKHTVEDGREMAIASRQKRRFRVVLSLNLKQNLEGCLSILVMCNLDTLAIENGQLRSALSIRGTVYQDAVPESLS